MHDDMKDRIGRVIAFGMGTDESPENIARAVLEAMREPTEAMVEAVASSGGSNWTRALTANWRTMIDAELSYRQKDAANAR